MFRPYTVPADHKDFQVGDQAHITLYTDTNPYTVIERKGKRIKLQRANAKLDPTWKPERPLRKQQGTKMDYHRKS